MAECRPKHAQSSGCNLERPDWLGHEMVITENYTGMMAMVLLTSWHRDRLDRLCASRRRPTCPRPFPIQGGKRVSDTGSSHTPNRLIMGWDRKFWVACYSPKQTILQENMDAIYGQIIELREGPMRRKRGRARANLGVLLHLMMLARR